MIDKKEAVLRVQPQQLDQLLHPVFDSAVAQEADAAGEWNRGIARRGGGPRGVFGATKRWSWRKTGPVILVRKETTPDDIHGMDVAKGILTAVGGKSSHAAVVARGMGRPVRGGRGRARDSTNATEQFTTASRAARRSR